MVGTAVPVRWIVDVERLSERDASTQKDGASITVLGKLRSGDAVAGETPGTVIEAAGITWALDLSQEAVMPARAESLAKKMVVVKGRIERVSETESPQRMIIRVNKLDASTGNAIQK